MNLNFVAGVAATVALFVPILLISAAKLFTNSSLLALLINYLLTALYNLMAMKVIPVSPVALHQCSAVFNYLDAPLMLVAFLFFCPEKRKKQYVWVALALVLAYELVIAAIFGIGAKSNMYVLGFGTPLMLGYTIYFFSHYGKMSIVQGKSIGKTMMLVSNLFSYGCFTVLYCLYYLLDMSPISDVMFMYHILTFIYATFMSIGLVWVIRRVREMKELQLTRKELALFFDK